MSARQCARVLFFFNDFAGDRDHLLVLAGRPGSANILLPRPGYLFYEARAAFNGMEVRYFDLLPESGWEADLDAVEAIADGNSVAMVIVNPGNPYANVYPYDHLAKASHDPVLSCPDL